MEAEPLYRRLADRYRNAIDSGTLKPGARMPSVRVLMRLHDVSLSTALQACRHLESGGLLEARPRSGYFVRRPVRARPVPVPEPAIAVPDPAQYVGMHKRISALLACGHQTPVRLNLAGGSAAVDLYPNEAMRAAAMRALRAFPSLFGAPLEYRGHPAFRAALAKRALRNGISIEPHQIVVTHGCIEALNLALRAVAGPGDVIAVESPTYYGLLQILESLGMRALEIPTSPATGISLEALDLAAQTYPSIKAVVVVPVLQNPLGSIMPDDNKRRLVQWCSAQQIALIEDDTFAAMAEGDTPIHALKGWDTDGNVIHCASLNKTLGPGLRLGWISGGRWQARVEMLKHSASRPNESLPQLAAAQFIESGGYDRHLRQLKRELRARRDRVGESIAEHFPDGTRVNLPAGGNNLLVELPHGLSSETVYLLGLREGLHVAPGVMFSNSGRFDHYLRLNCGGPPADLLDEAVRTLARIVTRVLADNPPTEPRPVNTTFLPA